MRSRVILATRSEGKLRELRAILAAAGIDAIDLREAGIAESPEEDALESHLTFEENALAKARYFNRVSGEPVMADDSGLCVDALGGGPGVFSKRYSQRSDLRGQALDDANNARLIEELTAVEDRSAKYVCAAAYADGPTGIVVLGETRGSITLDPRGANGFGYDPFFHSAELGLTFGEAAPAEKERASHRGRAFRELVRALRERGLAL